MDMSIHDVRAVQINASSLSSGGKRFHLQELQIIDKNGVKHCIALFFENVGSVIPAGDFSRMDQADSNEDYMGGKEIAVF